MANPAFLLDENISRRVSSALAALGDPVSHVLDHLPAGTPDTEVFMFAGGKGWALITQDKKIRKKPHERKAMIAAGVGVFIFTGSVEKSTHEMAIQFIARFPEIAKLASRTTPPYVFGIPDRGKIERLE